MVIPVGTLAARLDLIVQKGAEFKKTLTFTGEDFTGDSGKAQIRATATSDDLIVEMGVALNTADVVLTIASGVSSDITEDKGVWSLELTIGGNVIRVLDGDVTFVPETTR